MTNATFSSSLRRLRCERKHSQASLGLEMKLSPWTIRNWEQERRLPNEMMREVVIDRLRKVKTRVKVRKSRNKGKEPK